MAEGLGMMHGGHRKHVQELAEVVGHYQVFFPQMVLEEVNAYFNPRSGRDLMGVQHLDWQVAALDTCRALLDVVSDVCFHAGPVDTGSGQVHCLVDAGMASVEVYHDAVSARWWDDHFFTLGEEVTVNGEFISEAPVKSGCSGDTTLSVRPTIQGKPVHC